MRVIFCKDHFIKKSSLNTTTLPTKGMKVREIGTGRLAKITGVYESDNQVWMVSGNDVGFFSLNDFWNHFEEVKA